MRRPLTVLLLVTGLTTPAAARQSPHSGSPVRFPAGYLEIDRRVGALRSAMGSGSLTTALEAVIEQRAAWTVSRPPVETMGVPTSVDAAVAALHAAVGQARRMIEKADERDPGAVHGAALLVASALDRSVPSLVAAGDIAATPGRARVEGCDLVDQVPHLCVGSEADNVYREDVALLIDVGGNDTYENSAGGAPFLSAAGGAIPISVNVDAGGDDVYTGSTPHPEDPRSLLGQGAAYSLAVGILVDATGDDRYSMIEPEGMSGSWLMSQGAAAGTAVAGLFDLEGNDRYLARAQSGTDVGSVVGQAYASNLSAAVLSDAGGGNDTYEADGGTVLMEQGWQGPVEPSAGVGAQAIASIFSSAVVFDDGGTDSFLATAAAINEGHVEDDEEEDRIPAPGAGVTGQGAAQTSAAFVLTGPGPTTFRVEIVGTGRTDLSAFAQGTGLAPGGIGVLDDLGGDDSYSLDIRQSLVRTIEVDDSCRSGGVVCPHAQEVLAAGGDVMLYGQGAAQSGGNGLLQDETGNDRYSATVEQRTTVELHDRLSAPSAPPELYVSGLGTPLIFVQGASTIGSGMLVELGGSDRYSLDLGQSTSAAATSAHADGAPRVVALQNGSGDIVGQGATFYPGDALFVDAAGSGDRVETTIDVDVVTPDPAGSFLSMSWWPAVQGAGVNSQFAVLGTDAVVRSSPSRPACPAGSEGFRGFERWTDCPSPAGGGTEADHQNYESASTGALATGVVPSAVGAKPSLAFTTDTATSAPPDAHERPDVRAERLEVGAVLRDPAGNPLAGEIVHFTLQRRVGNYWSNEWQADGVTGADGAAGAALPLSGWTNLPGGPWRVVASYDGGPGLYPRHVASPLSAQT